MPNGIILLYVLKVLHTEPNPTQWRQRFFIHNFLFPIPLAHEDVRFSSFVLPSPSPHAMRAAGVLLTSSLPAKRQLLFLPDHQSMRPSGP